MFSFNPDANNAFNARITQSNRVKESLIYLIDECSSKLNLNSDNVSLALNAISIIDRLTPEIHFEHHMLQSSMRAQNIAEATLRLSGLLISIINYSTPNNWISVSAIGNSDWEKFVIPEAIKLAEECSGNKAIIKLPNKKDFSKGKDCVSAALCKIARYDSNMFDEIHENVRMIKLFSGQVTMGFTDMRILGAMLIRLPRNTVDSVLYFYEHIIHEASHIHLNCLMASDPLILNDRNELFNSPLRNDPRPMIGVFHATFVSARIARSFLKLYQATKDKELLQPLAEVLDETIRGIKEIELNAKLSMTGIKLVDEMKDLFNTAKDIPVWNGFIFNSELTHRFGAGKSNASTFLQYIK
jgi:hypothetical protein